MFGPSHYVPILRWKQAERFALRYLREEDRKRITPLIELTPQTFKSPKTAERVSTPLDPAQVIHQDAKKLLESCANLPFFLDLRHVAADVVRTLQDFMATRLLFPRAPSEGATPDGSRIHRSGY
jgi:hypothetical protein